MNTTKRFLYGILSSALLAVGLIQAANRFDPMNRSLPQPDTMVNKVAEDTQSACWFASDHS